MREEDVPGAFALSVATFSDLERRLGSEPHPPPADPEGAYIRYRRLLTTDPGGAWVAERDGELAGCALALVREGLWGLSLLVVAPGLQSAGLGRALLSRAYAHGGDAVRGRVVLASLDPRALRAYARLGLTAHPCLRAFGAPRDVRVPPGVRDGTLDDLPLTEAVDRRVRGAAHGQDIAAQLEAGMSLLVRPGAATRCSARARCGCWPPRTRPPRATCCSLRWPARAARRSRSAGSPQPRTGPCGSASRRGWSSPRAASSSSRAM